MNIPDYIKSNVSIQQVVESYSPLKKHGSAWMASCPMHSDSNPSLSVSPEKGLWKCHSCGKGGDLITLVREVEGVSFVEAARILVERFQIPAPVKLHNRAVRQKIQELEQAGDKLGALAMIDHLKRRAA